ncbi:MAG: cell division protein FtsQ/DivIB [Lachnospiraceae bacterium]|nr:cell division protein FtsQ/DivIB [Lachnospiraceae bacterium]
MGKETGKKDHKKIILVLILVILIAGLGCAGIFIQAYFKVKNVYVEGNVHYTSDEIMEYVMTGPLGHNSLYLSLKYKNKGVEGVPFVETMDVSILSADTIRISVYEKSLAGYVQYLDNYMYFDKDGVIVESSKVKTAGIPQVTGLQFNHVVLYQPLPVDDTDIFQRILVTTQLLNKYELTADKIYFKSDYEMSIYFGDVRVIIGTDSNVDEKIMLLQSILGDLEGQNGTLDLSEYSEDATNVTFEPN